MTHQQILEKAIQKAIKQYDIAEDSTITNKKTGRVVKGSLDRKGYRYVQVYMPDRQKQKKVKVHRLVAIVHVPNPHNLPFVNHIDGNPANNHADNLEWVTEQYNVIDGFNRGRVVWNKGNMSKERIMYLANRYPRQIFWYLTCNDFAASKAFWGENVSSGGLVISPGLGDRVPFWKYHLQAMVVASDPIKYLGDHLDA